MKLSRERSQFSDASEVLLQEQGGDELHQQDGILMDEMHMQPKGVSSMAS